MEKTTNYNLKKPGGDDFYNVQDQNDNIDIIDTALSPTADPAQVPTGNSGKLVQWVSWIANRIKAITGAENWYDAPAMTIKAIQTALGIRPTMTTADLTYYVNTTTGNDNNNGTNSGTAFRTIAKAISVIPKCVDHAVTINIADGIYYAEPVNIRGFIGKGSIAVVGNVVTPANVVIQNIFVFGNSLSSIRIAGFKPTVNTGWNSLTVLQATFSVWFDHCAFDGVSQSMDGVMLFGGGFVKVTDCTFTNCRTAVAVVNQAEYAWTGGMLAIGNCSGNGNGRVCLAYGGIIQKLNTTLPTASSADYSEFGGMIVNASGIPKGVLPLTGGTVAGLTSTEGFTDSSNWGIGGYGLRFTKADPASTISNVLSVSRVTDKLVVSEAGGNQRGAYLNIPDTADWGQSRIYHSSNITISAAAPGSALAEGVQHQVY